MTSGLAGFLGQYRGRGLLLDANLLLVLAIGQSDPLLIQIMTTPHILTEVSNQLGQSSEALRSASFEGFAGLIHLLAEHHVPSRELVGHDHLAVFGLTDLGILRLATSQKCLIITADSALADYLMRAKLDAVPYDWVRKLDRGW